MQICGIDRTTFAMQIANSPNIFLLFFLRFSSPPQKRFVYKYFHPLPSLFFFSPQKRFALSKCFPAFFHLLHKKYFLSLFFFFSYRAKIITSKLGLLSTCIACFFGWAMNLKDLFIGITPANLPARYQSTYSLKAKKLWKVWEPERGDMGEGVV